MAVLITSISVCIKKDKLRDVCKHLRWGVGHEKHAISIDP